MLFIFAGIFVSIVGAYALLWIYGNQQHTNPQKSRKKLVRESIRRLARDPKDAKALVTLGSLYYSEEAWDNAFIYLDILIKDSIRPLELSLFDVFLKHGVCALHLNQPDVAYQSLSSAYTINPLSIDVNYFLGKTFFELEIYDKAIRHLLRSEAEKKNDGELLRCLGIAYYNCAKPNDALKYLETAILVFPGNAEILYLLAQLYQATGDADKALESYLLLTANPQYGPESCLAAGALCEIHHDVDTAAKLYKIGVQHKRLTQENYTQLHYNLGKALVAQKNIPDAFDAFQQLENAYPGYSDTPALVAKYRELAQNHNFRVYLLGDRQDFETLCSHLVPALFPGFQTEIDSLTGNKEVIEIVAYLRQKEETLVMICCLRTENVVGELPVREFYGKVRDSKAAKGIFVTAGEFQKAASKFASERPVKLVNKAKLVRLLKKIKPIHQKNSHDDPETAENHA